MLPLVLASSSPFRAQLLAKLQWPFITTAPDIDETPKPDESAPALVERLAREKALAIAEQYPNAWIIGSDQVAVLGDAILGKPLTHSRAVAQLQMASGQRVTFYTGLALLNTHTGNIESVVEPFYVQFRPLTLAQIETYLTLDQPYHSAGSFKSESLGIALFEALEGADPNALVGLPLIQLVALFARQGFDILAPR